MARIALVEDDASLRLMAHTILARKGHDVVEFVDGVEALAAIRPGGFDLVVSDVQMPRMGGIELTRALRGTWKKHQLPVVLLSVLDGEDTILAGFDAGASDYLVKPYSPSLLVAKTSLLLMARDAPTIVEADVGGDEVTGRYPFAFDKYLVQGELGRGGMGVVYRAVRRSDGLDVALKVLDPSVTDDRGGLARYFREVAVLAGIDTPNVVRVIDSGCERGQYFLAMELLRGQSARALLHAEGTFPEARAARIAIGVCRALAALQERGLVHRDVKPSNVMVEPDGRVVLVDFGLAKALADHDITLSGEALGTPHYLAPEVVRGSPATTAGDLYALGVTLYELLTGAKPYAGRTSYETLQLALQGQPPPPVKASRPDLSDAFAAVLDDLMQYDPARRASDPVAVERRLTPLAGLES